MLILILMFSIYRMLFLALKKVQIIKITSPHVPTISPVKNSTTAKFLILFSTGGEFTPSAPYHYLENPDGVALATIWKILQCGMVFTKKVCTLYY